MLNDVKFALRQLRKSPGFAITALVTLALGIGANAVVFSVLNALILRPVNVPQGENIYMVQRGKYPSQSYLDYVDLRDKNRSFSTLSIVNIMGAVGVKEGNNSSTAWPDLVSGNYFDDLQIQPSLGRLFHASDEKGKNSAPYIVLTDNYWRGHFGADRSVIGRVIELNKHPFTIIGVTPRGFRGTEIFFAPAFFVPIMEWPILEGSDQLQYRGDHSAWVIGRLKPGVTPAQATSDLNGIGNWLSKTYPGDDEGVTFTLARPGLIGDMLGGPARAFMTGLMLLAGLILLAACANLGSLFAARAADRSKEIALRLALGSRRKLILRQLLTEAVLLALGGGALGIAGAVVVLHMISAWQPIPSVPINVPVNPDLRTYVVALVLALVSGMLFGMVPVRQVLRADPWQIIRTGMADSTMRRFTLRDLLLIFQIAICAVLITSSLVAVRGLARSIRSNYGFQPQNAVIVETDLQMAGYSGDNSPQMQRRMMDAIDAIPGVSSSGFINQIPLGLGGGDSFVYSDSTTDYRPTNMIADAMDYNISPGYLASAQTHLIAGRDLSFDDKKDAPVVALINRTFAVKVFGSVDKAIGGHFKFWGGNRAEVVGVVEDGKYRTVTEDQQPAMFFSFQQHTGSGTWLVVRSQRDPAEMTAAIVRTLHGLDSSMPLEINTWTNEMDTALFAARVSSVALGSLGLLGAMLAITGVFGMASYVVSKRLRELGIRIALGAGRREVLGASLGRAFRLLAAGSVAGIAGGIFFARVLSHIVYQATPKDPVVLGGVCATMLLLGLIASWIPARRALAVDPLILLREQ
ncbi:MAG TPA: ABC transporter permease [Terracidiphilus sp.]|nr:ABC transporter permease [Terracidiphilus sp.]